MASIQQNKQKIGVSVTILTTHDKRWGCRLEIARNRYHARHRLLRQEAAQTQAALQTLDSKPRQLYLIV